MRGPGNFGVAVFVARLKMNTCGGCTKCCEIVPVRELDKAGWEDCRHRRTVLHAAGPGCGIYQSRPASCRNWSCVWLTSKSWGPELRPDRLGIVVDPDIDLVRIDGVETPAAQMWVAPGHEDDFRSDAVLPIIVNLIFDHDVAVLWRLPGGKYARAFVKAPDGSIAATAPFLADKLGSLGPDFARARRVDQIFAARAQET